MTGRQASSSDRRVDQPVAVVVGLCAHGLAVARSLAHAGITVVALEEDASLPGTATRVARVERLGTTKGDGLVATLVALADTLAAGSPPVLFLTNDRMVRTVGEHWEELQSRYRLSWSECRQQVLTLMDKQNLESHCRSAGLAYPRTVVFDGNNFSEVGTTLGAYPALVKPSRPMGTFKAISVDGEADLRRLAEQHRSSLPFLVQQLIPGGDDALKVATFVLRRGEVLGSFEGRKLRSKPPCRGQGSVMQWRPNDRVRAAGEAFVAGLNLSGPVAIEFKEAPDGTLFVIEPTVGRTEYCVDAYIRNGCDQPVLEYSLVTGRNAAARVAPILPRIWCDTERDPGSLRQTILDVRRTGVGWLPLFPYLSVSDPSPFLKACRRYARAIPSRVGSRLRSLRRIS